MKQMLAFILSTYMRDITAETKQDIDFINSFIDIQASNERESQPLKATQICQEPQLIPIYPEKCDAQHFREANNHHSYCEPRPTLLKIQKPNNKWPILTTTIHRCAGSCTPHNPKITCRQAAIESVIIPVTLPPAYMPKVCQKSSPPCSKICGTIQLFNHTQCKCIQNNNNDYNESRSIRKANPLTTDYIEEGIAKDQNSTGNPCKFCHTLPAVATLATILLATNIFLASRLKKHLSQRHHENKEENEITTKFNSKGKEIEETRITWEFPPRRTT